MLISPFKNYYSVFISYKDCKISTDFSLVKKYTHNHKIKLSYFNFYK